MKKGETVKNGLSKSDKSKNNNNFQYLTVYRKNNYKKKLKKCKTVKNCNIRLSKSGKNCQKLKIIKKLSKTEHYFVEVNFKNSDFDSF